MATGLDWCIVTASTIAAFVPENPSYSIRGFVQWTDWIEHLLWCVCGVYFSFLDVGRNVE